MITEKIAKEFETYFARHIPILLKKSGLELKIANIGGRFNDEGILLEISAIPKSASKEQLENFLIDKVSKQQLEEFIKANVGDITKGAIDNVVTEGFDTAKKKKDKTKRFDLKRTGISAEKLRELHASTPHNYDPGTIYLGKKGSYALVGFSNKRSAFILYHIESTEKLFISEEKMKKLKKM